MVTARKARENLKHMSVSAQIRRTQSRLTNAFDQLQKGSAIAFFQGTDHQTETSVNLNAPCLRRTALEEPGHMKRVLRIMR